MPVDDQPQPSVPGPPELSPAEQLTAYLSPLVQAAMQGMEIMLAYVQAGMSREEARRTMVDLTRPRVCTNCRSKLTDEENHGA